MSELLQFIIVAAFGAFCFGCGYFIGFIVTRNRWRDEMIKRGVARYNWQTGKWEWGRATEGIEILNARPPLPAAVVCKTPRACASNRLGFPGLSDLVFDQILQQPRGMAKQNRCVHYLLADFRF